jgi:uncharacterized protein YdcH (DUF465 family)
MNLIDADFILLADAWDRLDNAAQNVTTSLPSRLTETVAKLDHERLAMRAVVHSILRSATAKEIAP